MFGANKGIGIIGKRKGKKVYFWNKVLRQKSDNNSLTIAGYKNVIGYYV